MITKISKIIYIFTIFLLLGQVWLSSWRSTEGDVLSKTQIQIDDLNAENLRIRTRIYEITSLEYISEFAIRTDMQPAKIANLSSITVALNR